MSVKYIHDEINHNLLSPRVIVPLLIDYFEPKSVVDVGCGIGTFLRVFKEHGIDDLLGIDGTWVNRELLSKNIQQDIFHAANLEELYSINRKYDMAICLEVAEHIKESSAHVIVETLVGLSDIIIFSAAIPEQGGQNHINEQWPQYWQELFEKYNYVMLDVLRPVLWDKKDVFWWYKQNIFVIVKKEKESWTLDRFKDISPIGRCNGIIHPELFIQKNEEIQRLSYDSSLWNRAIDGKLSIKMYIRMLAQYFLRKIFKK